MAGKADLNKQKKRESLLDSAFQLFMKNGFHKTSISDIVEQAGVAKGTFYLYFKDKYDLRNHLISHKASLLFDSACRELSQNGIQDFEEQVICVIDHILDRFAQEPDLLVLISKHLSWGIFKISLDRAEMKDSASVLGTFLELLQHSAYRYRDPELMMYLIIELVSGASYNAILYGEPVSLKELKPALYRTVRTILREQRAEDPAETGQSADH